MDRLTAYRFAGQRLVPTLTHCQRAYRNLLLSHLKAWPRWLDLGCGHQFTPEWAGVPEPDLLFAPASFDLVTANGVFIFHTPNLGSPLVFIASITPERFTNAVVRSLEGRTDEDIYPTAYRINTTSKATRLGIATGLTVESCSAVMSDALTWKLGPLSASELLWIWAMQWKPLAGFRHNIIAVFRKATKGS